MTAKQKPTIDRLREAFRYDPDTGQITRDGKPTGCIGKYPHNYLKLTLDGVQVLGHRVAWAMIHGRWPHDQIDHINGNRHDNRLANLRECSPAQNAQNIAALGYSFHKRSGKWLANISDKDRTINLGKYETREEARAAYLVAKAQMHPFNPVSRLPAAIDKLRGEAG